MDIWLIKRPDCDYDENAAHVIAADDEVDARRAAADIANDEGPGAWLDDRRSRADRIGRSIESYPEATVLLTDFRAG